MSRSVLLAGLVAALSSAVAVPVASAATATKVVRYHGYRLTVPSGWPVYRLSSRSTVCVRFNRHAVYLGKPGVSQNCPTNATGRTEAILVQPRRGARSLPLGGSPAHVVVSRHGVVVTATWRRNPAVIRRALGVRSLVPPPPTRALRPPKVHAPPPAPRIAELLPRSVSHLLGPPAAPGAIYQGLGFDACSAPSTSAMAKWAASAPFGAVGIYIGGANIACAQPNLSATWVTAESQAGWHLIPIYVGLQAPSNSCGCAAIVAAAAGTEGAAAAADAVAQAQALGIGPGNPIYFDMEGYTHTRANTGSVLTFLGGWTAGLHAAGFKSGVYSNPSSGIADLVKEVGTGYPEPDDVWFADWNGQATVSDAGLPPLDWAYGQRIHQYRGGHTDLYGGVKINIDTNYLDGATAAAGTAATVAAAPPVAAARPTISGTPLVGQTLTEGHATWSGSPASFSYEWERCNRSGAGCKPIGGATGQQYVLHAADRGRTLRVLEDATNAVGPGSAADSSQTAAIYRTATGYWSFTGHGEVYNSLYQHLYGAPASSGSGSAAIAGMAATSGGLGYWLVTRGGTVYHYGTAAALAPIHPSSPVVGIVTDAVGGYWLYTGNGHVYSTSAARFYGSLAHRQTAAPIVGMAADRSGRGYWLLERNGVVHAFGNARKLPRVQQPGPFAGIVASPHGGYWLFTSQGNVVRSGGTPWYGSPRASRVHSGPFTGMLATPDGGGYWLTTSAGAVYAYGDAKAFPVPAPAHPVEGLAGPSRRLLP